MGSIRTSVPFIRFSGISAALLFGVTALLQLLLASGILPVTMAWGGRQPELTFGLRLASLVSMLALSVFAYIILLRSGIIQKETPTRWVKILSWVITGFLLINTLGNLTSLSVTERVVFTPISFCLFLVCLFVSISSSENSTKPEF